MRTAPVTRESEHHVQLFDSSRSLAESVTKFLAGGLERGDNVLIAATPQHRQLLSEALDARGWRVRDAVAANRLMLMDAAQTLGSFMRRDLPNPAAFDEVIGTAVGRLAGDRRVWIYGEMVDVLAAAGNFKGAQALEDLWNVLGRRECFTLFCGYASGHFGDPRYAEALGQICAAHSLVHRKADDLLAEFLLEQPAVKTAAGGRTGSPYHLA
jgi:hypothetical protein